MDDQRTMKTVFNVVERQGKSFWVRVGVGFVNKDGSMNLALDAIPINGKLQVRDWEPPAERRNDWHGGDVAGQRPRPRPPVDASGPSRMTGTSGGESIL